MMEDKVRSVFEIEYTRWLLTTIIGLLLFMSPEIFDYFHIKLQSYKAIFMEIFGFSLITFSFLFIIKYPNVIVNFFAKNTLEKEKQKNKRLVKKLQCKVKECSNCKYRSYNNIMQRDVTL